MPAARKKLELEVLISSRRLSTVLFRFSRAPGLSREAKQTKGNDLNQNVLEALHGRWAWVKGCVEMSAHTFLLVHADIYLPVSGPQMSLTGRDQEQKGEESRLRRKGRMTSAGLSLFVRLWSAQWPWRRPLTTPLWEGPVQGQVKVSQRTVSHSQVWICPFKLLVIYIVLKLNSSLWFLGFWLITLRAEDVYKSV